MKGKEKSVNDQVIRRLRPLRRRARCDRRDSVQSIMAGAAPRRETPPEGPTCAASAQSLAEMLLRSGRLRVDVLDLLYCRPAQHSRLAASEWTGRRRQPA